MISSKSGYEPLLSRFGDDAVECWFNQEQIETILSLMETPRCMMFFYIDESGTSLNDPESPFFVLAALQIPTALVQGLDRNVSALKRRLVSYAKPEDFEIKGRDLRQGHRFFKPMDWPQRVAAMQEIATMIQQLQMQALAVRVDTRDLPETISSDVDLYRLAFWRLLDAIDLTLQHEGDTGVLLLDTQSTAHSSVQDRRLIDAYQDWLMLRNGECRLVERPLFGFSSFYPGLQLADFVAYTLSVVSGLRNKEESRNFNQEFSTERPAAQQRNRDFYAVFETLQPKLWIIDIP